MTPAHIARGFSACSVFTRNRAPEQHFGKQKQTGTKKTGKNGKKLTAQSNKLYTYYALQREQLCFELATMGCVSSNCCHFHLNMQKKIDDTNSLCVSVRECARVLSARKLIWNAILINSKTVIMLNELSWYFFCCAVRVDIPTTHKHTSPKIALNSVLSVCAQYVLHWLIASHQLLLFASRIQFDRLNLLLAM